MQDVTSNVESGLKQGARHSSRSKSDAGGKRIWGVIVQDILSATLKPEKKMRIMYRANLNYDRFNGYFYDLLEKGFIEQVNGRDGKPAYKVSERGKVLLAALRKVDEIFFCDEP